MEELIQELEEKLGWGDSRHWSRYDFERLSERIMAETKTALSVSTLMRVFGKVEYRSRPSVTTLNTLAQFLGYTDWRNFSARHDSAELVLPARPRKARLWYLLLLGGALISILLFLSGKETLYRSEDFSFSSRKVLTTGVPNSVVFDYDASRAGAGDSVYISQDWDISRKIPVSRKDKHHSSIYYFPGYFKAKLLVGSQVVKEHSICIMTDGWLGLIENTQKGEPFYLKDIRDPETGVVSVKDSMENGQPLPASLYNVREFKGILSDDFVFETEVKGSSTGICERLNLFLLAEDDILTIPLVKKGCTGDLQIYAFGHTENSRNTDLTGFGVDPRQWNKVRIAINSGKLKILINQKEVYTKDMQVKPATISGVLFRFSGGGAVRNTLFESGRNRVEL
ncbi:MAG: hypothetical protein KF870_13695 [Leadbetterella sp.]|nr:hypothetical protein [Leadbetterella sp.]